MDSQNEIYRLRFIIDQLEGELNTFGLRKDELKKMAGEFRELSFLLSKLKDKPPSELIAKIDQIKTIIERR